MRVFVINLDRRVDRLEAISADLKQHDIAFERIEAVDAKYSKLIPHYFRPLLFNIFGKNFYSRPLVANYLSHRKVWEKMVAENIPSALILEDDAKVQNWKSSILNLDIHELGLDALRLGANLEPAEINTENFESPIGNTLGLKLIKGPLWGNVATIITLEAAQKFLSVKKYWFPTDHFHSYEKCFGLKHATICPLVWITDNSSSDVQTAKEELAISQITLLRLTKRLRSFVLQPMLYFYLRMMAKLKIPLI